LWLIKVWFSELTFVVKIATIAKLENDRGYLKRRHALLICNSAIFLNHISSAMVQSIYIYDCTFALVIMRQKMKMY
jgi:hypothetical protein